MKSQPRKLFPFAYSPGKKLFHFVVKISDAPGSLSAVVNLLGGKVNLIGTGTYTLSDGTAMFSGFSEALSPKDTPESIKKLIMSSKAAIDAEVFEGEDGLLVDSYHTGLEVGGDAYMLFRRKGMAQMLDHVVKILGSGGESLLYEEGMNLGEMNAEYMQNLIGKERVGKSAGYMRSFLTAQGWGTVEVKPGQKQGSFIITMEDCFECPDGTESRKGCNFLRGYFAGASEMAFGKPSQTRETKCRLKGDKVCEFTLMPTV